MNVQNSTTRQRESCTNSVKDLQWEKIDWKQVYTHVNRLQSRIAKATKEKKWHLVKRLQHLLNNSFYAKLLAVRIVTSSKGKRTAGVDGKTWNTSKSKFEAAKKLNGRGYKAKPLKRIYIPKPGKSSKRPISIPTMHDRAMQALYNLSLQPIAETLSDRRSFGFRSYRSAKDAIQYAFLVLHYKTGPKWILEGDISGCFDNINHSWICENIPTDKRILRQFLKAGYIFEGKLYPTNNGTPQGGQISPILANMTLDGLESLIMDKYSNMKVYFIRYADDFIVATPTEEITKEIKELVKEFLQIRGLALSDSKTSITEIDEGVDFLGFNIRKYHGILLIKPSKEAVKKIVDKTGEIIRKGRALSQDKLIQRLNPIIQGWSNYYSFVVSSDIFSSLDNIVWNQLWKWGKHRHKNKGRRWIAKKYWHMSGKRRWDFSTETQRLKLFSDTKIRRHTMIKLDANPYLDKEYFDKRGNKNEKCTK